VPGAVKIDSEAKIKLDYNNIVDSKFLNKEIKHEALCCAGVS